MSTLIHRLVTLAANSSSSASPALWGPDSGVLSYRQLLELAAYTQAGLRGLKCTPKSRIALVVNNGPLAASSFIATAAAAACAPLNPGYGVSELEYYSKDLGIGMFLCDQSNIDRVRPVAESLGVRCLLLKTDNSTSQAFFRCDEFDGVLRGSDISSFLPPDEDAVALLLHTSGTTSAPKRVPLSWRNLSASAKNVAGSLSLDARDVCLNVMPLFHIHGLVACVLATLHSGGSVYCTKNFQASEFLGQWLDESAASWYSAVPTIHQALLREAADASVSAHQLRFARSSSASLPPSVLAELTAMFDVPVVEAYGMTEAAHQMACNPLNNALIKPGSVGMPAGPQVAVMAERSAALLDAGGIGEIVIQGPNVMRGYVDNEEANRSAFEGPWFRTGDQGYFDSQGYLFLTGRLKEIVNRGGEKISPREVDEAALDIAGVVQAVAFARPHSSLGEDLAMAVVLAPNSSLTPVLIRSALFDRLAPFKVPSEVVIVASIPKGPTGKLQRIGLAEKLATQLAEQFEPPRSELERIVVSCLLGALPETERIGLNDNFFAQGGDSLSGNRVTAELSELLGLELGAAELFRHPTAALIAERIASKLQRSGIDSLLLQALCSHNPKEFEAYLHREESSQ